jgi:3-hydroxybutyryl-CoA dehydrogenase
MAMQKGVNYPRGRWPGPMPSASTRGRVLRHLGATYGEDRYRVSPLIQRLQASGRKFHE